VAKDANEFCATLSNLLRVLDLVFHKDSYIWQQLNGLLTAIKDGEQAFAKMAATHVDYLASLMTSIDIKVQLFLKSCAQATTAADVDWSDLDFTEEKRSFKFQRPLQVAVLAAAVKALEALQPATVTPQKVKRGGNASPDPDDPDKKKRRNARGKKSAGEHSPTPHKNSSPVDPAWLLKPNEGYGAFAKQIHLVPLFKGAAICAKFHVQGSCPFGDTCSRAVSHTNKLDAAAKSAMDVWVQQCRGVAPAASN
jgi:Zinc finger C-x8-C-x5-C-x3-H type (and similar)